MNLKSYQSNQLFFWYIQKYFATRKNFLWTALIDLSKKWESWRIDRKNTCLKMIFQTFQLLGTYHMLPGRPYYWIRAKNKYLLSGLKNVKKWLIFCIPIPTITQNRKAVESFVLVAKCLYFQCENWFDFEPFSFKASWSKMQKISLFFKISKIKNKFLIGLLY